MGAAGRTCQSREAREGEVVTMGKAGRSPAQAKEWRPAMKLVAIYARVSTSNGQNPEMQLEELRTYCKRRGWEMAGEYTDAGVSGAKEHRPALDRLLITCRKRQVDAVVVYRYDRFARSL